MKKLELHHFEKSLTFDSFLNEMSEFLLGEKRLLVAISGGVDSVALLHLCLQLQPNHKLFAVHVNHGLRHDSKSEQSFIERLCLKYKIPLLIKRFKPDFNKKESVEMWARRVRLNAFLETRKEFDCDYIMTAHHSNDNLETILMHLDDGCGVEGLRGIPKQNGFIIRPLLNFTRQDITKYIHQNNLNYLEDSSNLDTSIKRNFVRHKVIKPWEIQSLNLIERFNALAKKATRAVDRMNCLIEAIGNDMLDDSKPIIIEYEWSKYLSNNQLVRLIKYLVGEIQISWRGYRWTSLEQWIAAADTGSTFKVNANWTLLRNREEWVLKKNTMGSDGFSLVFQPIHQYEMNDDPSKEVIDGRAIIGKEIILRQWKAGDRFQPLGMTGKKRVSDLLVDEKVDLFNKKNQLVVTADGEIIWVCGRRISDKAKVTEKTKNFVELSLVPRLG